MKKDEKAPQRVRRIPSTTIKHSAPKEGERLRFSASLIQQANKQFFSVTIPTSILAECCFVTSRNEDPQTGFQRVLDKKRAKDIANYIDSGEGTIPGSIILSAQPDAQLELVGGSKTIEFTFTQKAFLVLDGQHRVYGFSLAERAFRVPVVIYSGLTPTEEARLFIDINTKQRQVPNELLLDIKQLAERESNKEITLRNIFDLFTDEPSSALYGLTSASARKKNKLSRVTFNLAFKSVLTVFNSPDPQNIYKITNSYISAFYDALSEAEAGEKLVSPIVFRAIMDTFPEVARISAAQHGKEFTKSKFASVISPIAQQLSAAKIEKMGKSVRDLSGMFSRLIKKDFSI
ncbi:TPA: DGQHR domain-containing protein [Pseudomonas aeruginosa]|uniref:DGQHR domain-containing protein n=1 Tax=Pseudomonas aeruginosa TaxID=287 RepID=UPI00044EC4F6|nr:DGQHR domain-containing protein [Pseudomonas aeruginosa]ELL1274357.1 DGQHR domain-containing protein [Pseudomonas aeruginosa]EZO07179.1 hypothetical protein AJ64_02536 [Pseudomonas aeruginosa 3577]MBI8697926.1 DGQHR domain-containing protein [Pseudomonas aeruginosa]MBP8322981.1 DGQHR domain-containing protein [Pseudomonas aeruginosa]MBP8358663.1 DGQHR domain-containing protein [Pseudomonas aeruginosa]